MEWPPLAVRNRETWSTYRKTADSLHETRRQKGSGVKWFDKKKLNETLEQQAVTTKISYFLDALRALIETKA